MVKLGPAQAEAKLRGLRREALLRWEKKSRTISPPGSNPLIKALAQQEKPEKQGGRGGKEQSWGGKEQSWGGGLQGQVFLRIHMGAETQRPPRPTRGERINATSERGATVLREGAGHPASGRDEADPISGPQGGGERTVRGPLTVTVGSLSNSSIAPHHSRRELAGPPGLAPQGSGLRAGCERGPRA